MTERSDNDHKGVTPDEARKLASKLDLSDDGSYFLHDVIDVILSLADQVEKLEVDLKSRTEWLDSVGRHSNTMTGQVLSRAEELSENKEVIASLLKDCDSYKSLLIEAWAEIERYEKVYDAEVGMRHKAEAERDAAKWVAFRLHSDVGMDEIEKMVAARLQEKKVEDAHSRVVAKHRNTLSKLAENKSRDVSGERGSDGR